MPVILQRHIHKILEVISASNYVTTNRSKHYLKCHLILDCKYRKPLFVGQLDLNIRSIFHTISNKSNSEIEVFERDRDHVHFLLQYIPKLSIAQIARRLKQESTHQLWKLHNSVLHKQCWNQKLLWSDGYLVSSIGEASPETIRTYILSQGQSLTSHPQNEEWVLHSVYKTLSKTPYKGRFIFLKRPLLFYDNFSNSKIHKS